MFICTICRIALILTEKNISPFEQIFLLKMFICTLCRIALILTEKNISPFEQIFCRKCLFALMSNYANIYRKKTLFRLYKNFLLEMFICTNNYKKKKKKLNILNIPDQLHK